MGLFNWLANLFGEERTGCAECKEVEPVVNSTEEVAKVEKLEVALPIIVEKEEIPLEIEEEVVIEEVQINSRSIIEEMAINIPVINALETNTLNNTVNHAPFLSLPTVEIISLNQSNANTFGANYQSGNYNPFAKTINFPMSSCNQPQYDKPTAKNQSPFYRPDENYNSKTADNNPNKTLKLLPVSNDLSDDDIEIIFITTSMDGDDFGAIVKYDYVINDADHQISEALDNLSKTNDSPSLIFKVTGE